MSELLWCIVCTKDLMVYLILRQVKMTMQEFICVRRRIIDDSIEKLSTILEIIKNEQIDVKNKITVIKMRLQK